MSPIESIVFTVITVPSKIFVPFLVPDKNFLVATIISPTFGLYSQKQYIYRAVDITDYNLYVQNFSLLVTHFFSVFQNLPRFSNIFLKTLI
jgi:hypothetical protein